MPRILLVEDDSGIIENLTRFLAGEGFEVTSARTRGEALERINSLTELVLLDVGLPDGNGFSVCAEIKRKYDVPVIFLTASGDEFSVVTGLELGADDYIAKPFRPRELVSRMRSVLRRAGRASPVIEVDGLRVDTEKAQVTRDGQEIFLSALEYKLLLVFLNNRGRVMTRAKLLEEIWDAAGDFVNDNTLTVYIKRLRDKIEPDPAEPTVIRTVRGLGYKVE